MAGHLSSIVFQEIVKLHSRHLIHPFEHTFKQKISKRTSRMIEWDAQIGDKERLPRTRRLIYSSLLLGLLKCFVCHLVECI
jgi:hypothetical protein